MGQFLGNTLLLQGSLFWRGGGDNTKKRGKQIFVENILEIIKMKFMNTVDV